MSAPPQQPPNYPSTPGQQAFYVPPEKAQYVPGGQQQFSPPPQQQYPPPPGQPPQQGQQQQYYPPPSQPPPPQMPQQQYPQSPGQYSHQQQQMPMGYPQGQQPMQQGPPAASTVSDTIGTFNGGSFRIDHRDCNTILTVNLAANAQLLGKPGAMVAMSADVDLKGQVKLSMKKLFTGGEMSQSVYTGPGEIVLAPPALGDIIPIRLDGQSTWSVGKDAFLACTPDVKKDMKSQGLGKAMFSGEGLFVYKISGHGIMWITSLGAIITKHLSGKDEYFVDNDHLVAWNCKYSLERVSRGGVISGMASAEGLACKFKGPGTVFIQTRNPTALGQWIASHMNAGGR